MVLDKQNDIKNVKILKNGPEIKEISFERQIETEDPKDVNLQDVREVFVFTQHEQHLEVKREDNSLDMFELNHDMDQYTGRYFHEIRHFLRISTYFEYVYSMTVLCTRRFDLIIV